MRLSSKRVLLIKTPKKLLRIERGGEKSGGKREGDIEDEVGMAEGVGSVGGLGQQAVAVLCRCLRVCARSCVTSAQSVVVVPSCASTRSTSIRPF